MCEYCHQHGEGKKWYLQASNYSQDLKSDLEKNGVFSWDRLGKEMQKWLEIKQAPYLERAVQEPRIAERVRNLHFGQVLPIEDVEKVFDIVNNIVRLECICRQQRSVKEQRYCYGITLVPQGGKAREVAVTPGSGFLDGVDTSGFEAVDKETALQQFRDYEKEGLCHSVWTALTPFVIGVCNCDRADCGAMQHTLIKGMPIMYRAEYVAELDPEKCNGCRACMRVCQFGAIGYSAGNEKSYIDISRCYGCGVCRSVCTRDAIRLVDRAAVPAAANLW